jgi:hypothetical protein
MPNTSLRSALDSLAQSFASGVLAAIRTASLDDLLAEGGGASARRGPGRPRGSTTKSTATAARASAPARTTTKGRLVRRSQADIEKTLAQVVALVRKSKGGLRSEQIRATLKLDRRELPRVLYEGLSKKKLKSKGQKRATTYSAV